jgi:membrane fusion protein (multidrug efflux system)
VAGLDAIRRRKKLVLAVAAALLVAALGFYFYSRGRVSTDDAQIDGHIHTISARVPGYVSEVLVADNELVEKDQPLVRLDPVEYEVALADAVAGLTSLEEDSASAGHDVQSAESEYSLAMLDLNRNKELIRSQSVSQSAVDQAQTRADTARAKLNAAKARLAAIGARNAAASARSSKIEAQKAKVRQAALNLEYASVVAPVRGFVTRKAVEAGLMVAKGQPLMAVVPLDLGQIWITANYKETQLTHVRPGQPVTFEVDAYPGREFKGRVESIMAGTGASFSLFPPENAAGNYVKVVQRIPVKIVIEANGAESLPVLRVGMSVLPTIFIR